MLDGWPQGEQAEAQVFFVYIVRLVRMYVLIFHSEVIRKTILHALAAQVIQH